MWSSLSSRSKNNSRRRLETRRTVLCTSMISSNTDVHSKASVTQLWYSKTSLATATLTSIWNVVSPRVKSLENKKIYQRSCSRELSNNEMNEEEQLYHFRDKRAICKRHCILKYFTVDFHVQYVPIACWIPRVPVHSQLVSLGTLTETIFKWLSLWKSGLLMRWKRQLVLYSSMDGAAVPLTLSDASLPTLEISESPEYSEHATELQRLTLFGVSPLLAVVLMISVTKKSAIWCGIPSILFQIFDEVLQSGFRQMEWKFYFR